MTGRKRNMRQQDREKQRHETTRQGEERHETMRHGEREIMRQGERET